MSYCARAKIVARRYDRGHSKQCPAAQGKEEGIRRGYRGDEEGGIGEARGFCWNCVPVCSMLFNLLTFPSKPHLDILSVLGKSCGQRRIIVMGGHVIL